MAPKKKTKVEPSKTHVLYRTYFVSYITNYGFYYIFCSYYKNNYNLLLRFLG